MREINENVWINYVLNISKSNDYIIVDDVRYSNEIEVLKNNGFILIFLNISEEEQIKRIKNTYPDNYTSHIINLNHESEKLYFNRNNIDIILNTDEYSICELFQKIDNLILKNEKNVIDLMNKRNYCNCSIS